MERLPFLGPSSEQSGQEEPQPFHAGEQPGRSRGIAVSGATQLCPPCAGGSCGSLGSWLRRLGGGEALFLLLFLFLAAVTFRSGERAAFPGQGHGEGASAGCGAPLSLC